MNNGLMHVSKLGRKASANLQTGITSRQYINTDLDAANRRFALTRSGTTQRAVARDLRVSPEHVSMVINNKCTSRRVAQHLATITGLDIHDLWPDGRYLETGETA